MRSDTRVRMGRRGFLMAAAAATGSAILAACGDSIAATPTPTAATAAPAQRTVAPTVGAATTAPTTPAAATSIPTAPVAATSMMTGATAPATTAPAVQNSGQAVTITWFTGRDASGLTAKQVDAFNKQSKSIQIGYQEQGATSDDLHNKIVIVAAAKDTVADLFSVNVPNISEFATAGWVSPVDDLLPKEERAKFFAGTLDGATVNGKLSVVPWYNNGPGLWYRKDLLDGAGLKPPKTYDELIAACQKLQTPDVVGYVLPLPQIEQGVINWMEHLWGYGGEVMDDKQNIVLDKGTAGVQSLQRVIDYVYKDKIVPDYALTLAQVPDAMNIFRTGKAVFLRLWYSSGGDLYKDDTTIKGKWGVTTLPSQDGTKPGPGCLGTWNLGISAFSKHPKETAEVIRWLTSEEQQTWCILNTGNLPVRLAVFDNPDVQAKFPYAKAAQESFKDLKPRPITPYYSQFSSDAIQPSLGAAFTRQKSPEVAIKEMADKMRQIIK